MNEDIQYRVGVDTRPFQRAMRSLTRIAKDFGGKIREELNSAFGKFAAGVSLVGFANKLGDMADEVKGVSEAFGVSTDFIQGFRTAVSQNSGTVEQANKGLERLAVSIGRYPELFQKWGIALTDVNGKSKTTEQILFALADKMKGTSSGAERAAIAYDLLGKSGTALIPTLNMGAEALQNYIDAADKLSAEEIEEIANAQDYLKLKLDRVTIAFSNTVGWVESLVRAYKNLMNSPVKEGFLDSVIRAFGDTGKPIPSANNAPEKQSERVLKAREGIKKVLEQAAKIDAENLRRNETSEQKLARFGREKADQVKIVEDAHKTELERANALLEIRKIEKQIGEESAKSEKDKADAAKRAADEMARQQAAQKAFVNAKQDLDNARADRGLHTLAELAALNPNRFRRGSIAYLDAFDAKRVMDLENRARDFNTPIPERNKLLSDADRIRLGIQNLTSSERNPFKSLEEQVEAAKASRDHLANLDRKIGGTH